MHIDATDRPRWLWAVLLVGVVYVVAGIAIASLANQAATDQLRVAWRLSAWVISAAVFAAHIWYEQYRLEHSSRTTALHASLAVALAAFALAVKASAHAISPAAGNQRWHLSALLVWPLLTAVPAFVVALAASAGLGRNRRRA